MQTISGITYDLKQKLSLHIEHGQAIKWLEILCNCLFEFTQPNTNLSYTIEFKADFDFFEVQLFYKIIYLLFLFIANIKILSTEISKISDI